MAGPREEAFRHVPGTVAESEQPAAGTAQRTDAVGDIGVDIQLAEALHDMVGGCGDRAVEGDVVQDDVQGVDAERREGRTGAGGGEREAVPQEGGEAELGQVLGRTDVGEAPGHRAHVGQGLVDIEDDDGRGAHRFPQCADDGVHRAGYAVGVWGL